MRFAGLPSVYGGAFLFISCFTTTRTLAQELLTQGQAEPSRGALPVKPKFTDHPFLIQGRTGFDTLVGIIGMTASVDVENHLAIGVGFGTNLSGRQLAAFGRVRPFVWTSPAGRTLIALAFEVSYSSGPGRGPDLNLQMEDIGPSGTLYWHRIEWLQAEAAFELRVRSGFSLTAGMGAAKAMRYVGAYCTGDPDWCAANSGWRYETLPTFTIGLGYAF